MKGSDLMHRLINDPNDESKTKTPSLALLLVFPDGTIIENDTTEDVITVLTSKNYPKLNDEDKCLARIKFARRDIMYALQDGINAVITLKGEIVKNNYAVDDNDEDYAYSDEEINKAEKIIVDNEKDFLISLVKIGSIKILEKAGGTIFLEKTDKLPEGNVYTDIISIIK
jgi:hypothetical protein